MIATCLAHANGAVLPSLYAWDSMDLRMDSSDAKEPPRAARSKPRGVFMRRKLRVHAH